jgi:hypothetical protein
MADHEQMLRRLALNDDQSVAALLADRGSEVGGGCRDPQTRALVRLAAVIASDGACPSYQSAVDTALAAGAGVHDVVDVLISIAGTIGSARVVTAAPLLARAVGYDVDEVFDGDDAPSSTRMPRTDSE